MLFSHLGWRMFVAGKAGVFGVTLAVAGVTTIVGFTMIDGEGVER